MQFYDDFFTTYKKTEEEFLHLIRRGVLIIFCSEPIGSVNIVVSLTCTNCNSIHPFPVIFVLLIYFQKFTSRRKFADISTKTGVKKNPPEKIRRVTFNLT